MYLSVIWRITSNNLKMPRCLLSVLPRRVMFSDLLVILSSRVYSFRKRTFTLARYSSSILELGQLTDSSPANLTLILQFTAHRQPIILSSTHRNSQRTFSTTRIRFTRVGPTWRWPATSSDERASWSLGTAIAFKPCQCLIHSLATEIGTRVGCVSIRRDCIC